MRTVVWVSAGAASAVAAKLVLAQGPAVLAYTDPGSEHSDNARFLNDLEGWYGQEIVRLHSDRYKDTWDLWEQTRFLVGQGGARCTADLKRKLRFGFQMPDDRQVFGYTADKAELLRAKRAEDANPEVDWWWPLIEAGLLKTDCLAMVERAGITLPVMYQLGYDHNNCIGCVKGGIGYWNKIRQDFPVVFDRMARLEREVDHAILAEGRTKGERKPLWLDELDPDRGSFATEPEIDCSIMCMAAEASYVPVSVMAERDHSHKAAVLDEEYLNYLHSFEVTESL
jgi:hypothetical protein